jgi:hypothetical protein
MIESSSSEPRESSALSKVSAKRAAAALLSNDPI